MEYEDWDFRVRIFLNSEFPLFAFSRASKAEKVDEDVREEVRDFEGNTAHVVWMN